MNEIQEMDAITKFKKQLGNKLWITRKCRINASERLLKSAKFVDFINVYYSVFLILLSLISVSPYAKNTQILSYISIALSITLTISIIYASTLRYNERSAALKQNYISLQELMDRLELAKDEKEIRNIHKAYCETLNLVENHEIIDFIELIRTSKLENYSMRLEDWFHWVFYKAWNSLIKIVIVLIPVACLGFVLL